MDPQDVETALFVSYLEAHDLQQMFSTWSPLIKGDGVGIGGVLVHRSLIAREEMRLRRASLSMPGKE